MSKHGEELDFLSDPERRSKAEEFLLSYDGPDRVVSFFEKSEALKTQGAMNVRMLSGLPGLDLLIDAFYGGELIVISGPTKHGKTTLARTLTRNFLVADHKALWFSYELTAKELFDAFPVLPEAYLPNELTKKSMSWIAGRCLEAKLKYNTRAVFIDHLHFLVDMEKLHHPSLEIGSLVRRLKRVAVDLNICIFLICHLTKLKLEEEPTENELRDSSFIAQDADSTIMVWRRMDKKTRAFHENQSVLSVRNHRRTGVMGKKIDLVYTHGWLEEMSRRDEVPF